MLLVSDTNSDNTDDNSSENNSTSDEGEDEDDIIDDSSSSTDSSSGDDSVMHRTCSAETVTFDLDESVYSENSAATETYSLSSSSDDEA